MRCLSERLRTIAAYIGQEDVVADIGTDHGQLPVYLCAGGLCRRVIMTDISEASLAKATAFAAPYLTSPAAGVPLEARAGDGLAPLEEGEVDTVVMAGIGGALMCRILAADAAKARSVQRYILQPRRAPGELRAFLSEQGYTLTDERLVREGRYLWEVLVAVPPGQTAREALDAHLSGELRELAAKAPPAIRREVPPYYGMLEDPLMDEYLARKLARETRNAREQSKSTGDVAAAQRVTRANIAYLSALLSHRRAAWTSPIPKEEPHAV